MVKGAAGCVTENSGSPHPMLSFEVHGDPGPGLPYVASGCRCGVEERVLFFFNLVPTLTLGNSLGGGDPLLAEEKMSRPWELQI